MQKFIIQTIVYLLLLFIVFHGVMWIFPYSKSYGYNYVKDKDAKKISYVYKKMFLDKKNIDVAFVGTSHTFWGLSEEVVNNKLRQNGLQSEALNVAFPGRGRNHHLTVVEDLLDNYSDNPPKVIVLEVLEYESRGSHALAPIIASNNQFFRNFSFLNPSLFKDLSSFYQSRRKNIQKSINQLGGQEEEQPSYTTDPSFFATDTLHSKARMDEYAAQLKAIRSRIFLGEDKWNLEFHYPLSTVKKIARKCEEKGIKLVFVYLPYYGAPKEPHPFFTDFYRSHGPLLLPPQEFWTDYTHWTDADHLNVKGSGKYSSWVADELTPILSKE